jgi:hypothetical protein
MTFGMDGKLIIMAMISGTKGKGAVIKCIWEDEAEADPEIPEKMVFYSTW